MGATYLEVGYVSHSGTFFALRMSAAKTFNVLTTFEDLITLAHPDALFATCAATGRAGVSPGPSLQTVRKVQARPAAYHLAWSRLSPAERHAQQKDWEPAR